MSTPTFTVSIQPERSALLAGHPQTIHALVRIQAPAAPAANQQRQPLNLALVIDRSGSMSGTPLREARRCVQMILRSLQPTDSVAVVAFDDEVTVTVNEVRCADEDCPDVETIIGVLYGHGRQERWTVDAPAAEVTCGQLAAVLVAGPPPALIFQRPTNNHQQRT
jgi:hypothetical protein